MEAELNYVANRVDKIKKIDLDRFSSFSVAQLVIHLKYNTYQALWWKIPGMTLEDGRWPLYGDDDVRDLLVAMKGHAYIEIFIEHVLDIFEVLIEVCYGEPGESENVKNVDNGVKHKEENGAIDDVINIVINYTENEKGVFGVGEVVMEEDNFTFKEDNDD